MLDGKQIVTIEHLGENDGQLHPAQQAMIAAHGSQCGFCTPGIVMSLFTLYRQGEKPDRQRIDDHLAGNLCRCTGYGPIIESARRMFDHPEASAWSDRLRDTESQLRAWQDNSDLDYQSPAGHYLAPATGASLAEQLAAHQDATLVAGATDVGLWVTKQHRRLTPLIDVTRIAELQRYEQRDQELHIGAAVRYEDAMARLAAIFSDLGELVRRIGSTQVRHSGTIGGNIANGSPIGDMPPALIALDARIVLRSLNGRRELALEDFFIDYGRQDRAADEFLETVIIPLSGHGVLRCHKVSKRFDQDITACLGAFNITVEDDRVRAARIAYGGMAAIPKRARAAEAALIGQPWRDDTVEAAAAALTDDFAPISDMRASAGYRLQVARNLLRKVYLEDRAGASIRLAHRGTA